MEEYACARGEERRERSLHVGGSLYQGPGLRPSDLELTAPLARARAPSGHCLRLSIEMLVFQMIGYGKERDRKKRCVCTLHVHALPQEYAHMYIYVV